MSKKSGKILIIDDNEDVLLAARLFLKKHFAVIHTEKNPQNIPPLMGNEMYDVILLDMNFVRDVTSGSGIGLSLSRQILRLHKGTLSVPLGTGCRNGLHIEVLRNVWVHDPFIYYLMLRRSARSQARSEAECRYPRLPFVT